MADDLAITTFGDLSKPATTLIEKVSGALGGYFKPYQLKRVAKAKAEADLIEAQSQIEITVLQRRALTRWIGEESKKQQNIEAIVSKSLPQLTDSSNPQNMDDDWLVNFFENSRIISDEQMQILWGKILAGEANVPGSFSKRTINLLGAIDKNEAQMFANVCGFRLKINNSLIPAILDSSDTIYSNHKINWWMLKHLENIGLLALETLAGFKLQNLPKNIVIDYQGNTLKVILNTPDEKHSNRYEINVGQVIFTQTGKELAKVCDPAPVEDFPNYLLQKLKQAGETVSL